MQIYIDNIDRTAPVSIFGGEYSDNDVKFEEYGIQIGDLSFEIFPETAVELYKKLGEHLKVNGRIE